MRAIGRGIVRGMPGFMRLLMIVGTAAMLWVGGSIIVHSLAQMGFAGLEHAIDGVAESVAHNLVAIEGFAKWFVKAAIDGVLGLVLGLVLLPVVNAASGVFGKSAAH